MKQSFRTALERYAVYQYLPIYQSTEEATIRTDADLDLDAAR